MRNTISLCGNWRIRYEQERPEAGKPLPPSEEDVEANVVPGWWEDMYETLQLTPFWHRVNFNPEFRVQRYPTTGDVADMVLQTMVGSMWYRKRVFVAEELAQQDVLFRCAGVQNRGLLWVNGVFAGEHNGYSTPFSFDITKYIRFGEENELLFAVANHAAFNETGGLISGCTNRAANLYTGGIIGDTFLEFRNRIAIADVFVTTDPDSITVHTELTGPGQLQWEIYDGKSCVMQGSSEEAVFSVSRENLVCWSPKRPKLYTLKLTLKADDVVTDGQQLQFGVRILQTDGWKLRLNDQPIFLRGICEHGYFAKTVHPDPDIDYYLKLIKVLKKLDFNFIRLHTWVPTEEYLTAADRLGMLVHVESPNNTTEAEWADIMRFVRRHPSAVICCCGNEMLMDEEYIAHLNRCADICHRMAPGMLFSPQSALRGVEYCWEESNFGDDVLDEPIRHNPGRLEKIKKFSDVFNSYALSRLSYETLKGIPKDIDALAEFYEKPRLSHEICIQGTYVDFGMMWRYDGTRIGQTELYSSVYRDLKENGVAHLAPAYYNNSCKWQQLLRKHCFENARLCRNLAGYDYLGDVDHHWHTFGYRVGMMNEFYEMKPNETVENVRRYNSESVLLCDLSTDRCYGCADMLDVTFITSLYGGEPLENAQLSVRLETSDRRVLSRHSFTVSAPNGQVSDLARLQTRLPMFDRPSQVRIFARISQGIYELENEWDIWIYPEPEKVADNNILVTNTLDDETLSLLDDGADVLLLGSGPFCSNPLSFQIALPGRSMGNLATVIHRHPLTEALEHDGFCSWQFAELMNDASCIYYPPTAQVPFEPIIDVASSYKWVRRQAALAEFRVGKGRLLICTFNLTKDSVAANWWRGNLMSYMTGEEFMPKTQITPAQLMTLAVSSGKAAGGKNTNRAGNANDKTMVK